MLKTLDYAIRIGSTPTFLYFNFFLSSLRHLCQCLRRYLNNGSHNHLRAKWIPLHFLMFPQLEVDCGLFCNLNCGESATSPNRTQQNLLGMTERKKELPYINE